MTRNEFVADTARRLVIKLFAPSEAVARAERLATELESNRCAPWQPAPSDAEGEAVALLRKLVAGHIDGRNDAWFRLLKYCQEAQAFLARLDAKKGPQ